MTQEYCIRRTCQKYDSSFSSPVTKERTINKRKKQKSSSSSQSFTVRWDGTDGQWQSLMRTGQEPAARKARSPARRPDRPQVRRPGRGQGVASASGHLHRPGQAAGAQACAPAGPRTQSQSQAQQQQHAARSTACGQHAGPRG